MRVKATLSIGFSGATHEDDLDIDMDEYNALKTARERNDYLWEQWRIWTMDYIEGGFTIVHEDTALQTEK